MIRRLILVRHGVTDWNREGRFQGQLDPPLSVEGHRQARLVALRLASRDTERPDRLLVSSLMRAMETAQAIAAALGDPPLDIAPDPRLVELGQGRWEGRTHAELKAAEPEAYARWRAARDGHQPPGGEPVEDALARVRAALAEALGDAAPASGARPGAGNCLCIVGHGGTLRLAASHLLELPLERAWAMEKDNASVTILDRSGGGWCLVTWNDAGHLLGRAPVHLDELEGEPLAL